MIADSDRLGGQLKALSDIEHRNKIPANIDHPLDDGRCVGQWSGSDGGHDFLNLSGGQGKALARELKDNNRDFPGK